MRDSAALAFSPAPSVFEALEPDVAVIAVERFDDRVLAGGVLGAIHAAPREQGGDLRDADAEHLPGEDVVHSLLPVGNRFFQSLIEAAGDLAQEHAGFGAGVEERHRGVGPDIFAAMIRRPRLRQRVEHPVGKFRRGEHLVVGKIGDAGEHIGVAPAQSKAGLVAHAMASGATAANSPTVIGG